MIRKATSEDLDQIMQIVEASKEMMNREGSDQWDEEYPLRSDYEADIECDRLYVYEDHGQVRGVACFNGVQPDHYEELPWSRPMESRAFLTQRVAVDVNARGKGIAEQFYQYVEDLAASKEVEYLKTDTYSLNLAAQRVFEKAGYTYIGEWSTPIRKAPFYFYEKTIK